MTQTSPVHSDADAPVTVPGLDVSEGHQVAHTLQLRLHALNDLQLTLKHVHWNVAGPTFIAVHEMLDPQVIAVRSMTDAIAERIAATDHLLRRQRHEGERAFQLLHRVDEFRQQVLLGADGDEVQDRLGVGCRREDGAGALQFALYGHRVGDVSVVGDGEPA